MKTAFVTIIPAFVASSAIAECHVLQAPTIRTLTHDNPVALDGTTYTTRSDLMRAVAKLPPGSHLVWWSGCKCFSEIPVGSKPRMNIVAFKNFCSQHNIRFEYYCGYERAILVNKTYAASSVASLLSITTGHSIDARRWLEDQGVMFPTGASVAWDKKNRLMVSNTEENIELIDLIVAQLKR